jgi:hypothetical protein
MVQVATVASLIASLVLQCHFYLGYELAASLPVPEYFRYPLPEAFFAPFAVAAIYRLPWPELLFW